MAWKCGVCGEGNIEVVCHHCGKPLCKDHLRVVRDKAFSSFAEAYHCEACKEEHHSKVIRL